MSPDVFWDMTLKEFSLALEGRHDLSKEIIVNAWYTAALTRTQELPPLRELLEGKEEEEVSIEEIQADHEKLLEIFKYNR